MSQPVNTKLYNRVKQEAKKKFTAWPSAYASAWLVQEYKRRGGTYKGKKRASLKRWFQEDWIDVCQLPKRVPCGRKTATGLYPYCRPTKKISKKTPKLAQDLTAREIRSRCRQKRKNPKQKVRK